MLRKILNLEGAEQLTKSQQKSIKGGLEYCRDWDTGLCKYYKITCASPCNVQP